VVRLRSLLGPVNLHTVDSSFGGRYRCRKLIKRIATRGTSGGVLAPLLEIKDLHTEFRTGVGVVRAVDGVSYAVEQGETVAIVGESGSGKSVGALSILRLIPDPPGRITRGEVLFAGRDLMQLPDAQMREVRGGDIGMVFQEPMTSLNPVLTIGRQITETPGYAARP
jgi:ABC-type dipeptide/oligopeptide/nickel transport system ATPase component